MSQPPQRDRRLPGYLRAPTADGQSCVSDVNARRRKGERHAHAFPIGTRQGGEIKPYLLCFALSSLVVGWTSLFLPRPTATDPPGGHRPRDGQPSSPGPGAAAVKRGGVTSLSHSSMLLAALSCRVSTWIMLCCADVIIFFHTIAACMCTRRRGGFVGNAHGRPNVPSTKNGSARYVSH